MPELTGNVRQKVQISHDLQRNPFRPIDEVPASAAHHRGRPSITNYIFIE